MEFNDAQLVESVCYQLRYADWGRSRNRAAINRLFNGFAPFTTEEAEANGIEVNFSDLTACRKAHDARGQMYSSILKPGKYFSAKADIGPKHNRTRHSQTVTRHTARLMKKSQKYYELQRSKIAQAVLHGIGIGVWPNGDNWCPCPLNLEDMLVPSGEASQLPMDDLPLFAIHKSFTAPSLIALTRGPNVDPGWNMPMVESCIEWVEEQTQQLLSQNWPDMYSAEKWEERRKEGSWYTGDQVPTIDVYDFYFWSEGDHSGWKRRMILDAWGQPNAAALKYNPSRRTGALYDGDKTKGQFLYSSNDTIYADNKSEIASFQFADCSAVAPFRWHTIRGLGFMIHDACHVQNRLTCKITEATFETLTMLMRVKSQEDVQRALKANLFNRGFVDETVQFIPANERWNVNTGLVELGVQHNMMLIDQGSAAQSQNQDMSKGVEKGQLQIMAELNASTAMLSAALLQYYQYQGNEYREILRRLMNTSPTCTDVAVKEFRANCLRDGVPEEMLNNPEAWDVEPERVLGAGNKTMAMAVAAQLYAMRKDYDPASQRKIQWEITSEVADNSALADELVPDEPQVSSTKHDTELVYAALMGGHPVQPASAGVNSLEAAATTLDLMSHTVQEVLQSGGVGTPAIIKGLTLAAGYASHFIKILEQDKESKKLATQLNEMLGKLGNQIKAMAQRQAEMQKKAAAQNGHGGVPPETQAKIAADQAIAANKIKLGQQSHAAKTAQRQISFEEKLKQEQQREAQQLRHTELEHRAEVVREHRKTLAEIGRRSMRTLDEGDAA
jgi:hypothetical protein